MEWKAIAVKQREQLDRLQKELAQSDTAKSELEFALADIRATDSAKATETAEATERLLKKCEQENSNLVDETARLRQELAEQTQLAAAATAATVDHGHGVAEIDALMEDLRIARGERDALRRQLQAEKRANRKTQFATNNMKIIDDEDDDEESLPNQPFLRNPPKPTQTSTPPKLPASAFQQQPTAPLQSSKSPSLLVKLMTTQSSAGIGTQKSMSTRRPTTASPFKRRHKRVVCEESSDEEPDDASPADPPASLKREHALDKDSNNSEPSHATSPTKRKRQLATHKQLSDDELSDYDPNKLGLRTPANKKPRKAIKACDSVDLEFTMVTSYSSAGIIETYESEDMRDQLQELWERIAKVHGIWEDKAGVAWDWDFESAKQPNPDKCKEWPCITTKLMAARSYWRKGCEGKYACRNCVEANRPCFVYTGGKIWLLPLHKEDRVRAVKEGCEMRYWIADEFKKTLGTGDDDEDYSDSVDKGDA